MLQFLGHMSKYCHLFSTLEFSCVIKNFRLWPVSVLSFPPFWQQWLKVFLHYKVESGEGLFQI